jgi:hypothetical protein
MMRTYGGLRIVAGFLNVVFTMLMFDPFGMNSCEAFTAEESKNCEESLQKGSRDVKRAKMENDKGVMFLVYLKLVNDDIDGITWQLVEREGYITRVYGSVGGNTAKIAIWVLPETYSFTVDTGVDDDDIEMNNDPAVTYRALLSIVREWVRKITPVVV